MKIWHSVTICALALALSACAQASSDPPVSLKRGRLVENADAYGTYYTYVPTAPSQPEILVLVHGTPPEDETAEMDAHYYATQWVNFAEAHGLLLIAPAFNQADFSSRLGDHALGGYRGLFGREIGADAWVLRLVSAYQQALGTEESPIYVYGHSAGGQFTARFLVTHPHRVKKAVITSAATYPQPSPDVTWPFGLGELHTDIVWDAQTSQRVDIVPNQQTWLTATQVPLTVIVGLNDTAGLPEELIPGQKGRNRYTIAHNWVKDMSTFAGESGMTSCFAFEVIPGHGHSMAGLLSHSQEIVLSQTCEK